MIRKELRIFICFVVFRFFGGFLLKIESNFNFIAFENVKKITKKFLKMRKFHEIKVGQNLRKPLLINHLIETACSRNIDQQLLSHKTAVNKRKSLIFTNLMHSHQGRNFHLPANFPAFFQTSTSNLTSKVNVRNIPMQTVQTQRRDFKRRNISG